MSYDSLTGVTTYRNNILAGSEPVAVDSFAGSSGTSATETVNYLYADHLGSVEAVSDGNGANVVQYSYDAWGKARPTSGTGAYVSPGWGTCNATLPGKTTGYTGHENLTDVCLVDMEGRVYDPDLGRFVSADPMQGGDRYGYVDDNPLSETDPSGYFANGEAGVGQAISDIGPLLSTIQPFC